jgi:hypothetical protein
MLGVLLTLSLENGYDHTFAVRFYVRNDVNYINVNPVCKDGYHFAMFVSKLVIANDR